MINKIKRWTQREKIRIILQVCIYCFIKLFLSSMIWQQDALTYLELLVNREELIGQDSLNSLKYLRYMVPAIKMTYMRRNIRFVSQNLIEKQLLKNFRKYKECLIFLYCNSRNQINFNFKFRTNLTLK